MPTAKWTFAYQKFGYPNRFVYFMVAVHQEIRKPANGTSEKGIIQVVFTEVTSDGSSPGPPHGEKYSQRLGMFFDFFFRQESDIMKTSGVMLSVALLATLWSYYAFYFEDG
jgi:hypothetical protein